MAPGPRRETACPRDDHAELWRPWSAARRRRAAHPRRVQPGRRAAVPGDVLAPAHRRDRLPAQRQLGCRPERYRWHDPGPGRPGHHRAPARRAAVPGFTNQPFDYANPGANGSKSANSFAFGPDGKIAAAGIHCTNQPARGACQSPEQIGVARLNADGSLDTTFGTGGALTIAQGVDVDTLTVQPDGKILIAWDEGSGSTPMFARLLG